jgi:hypothetical protein
VPQCQEFLDTLRQQQPVELPDEDALHFSEEEGQSDEEGPGEGVVASGKVKHGGSSAEEGCRYLGGCVSE